MPFLAMPINTDDQNSPSRKRSHGEFSLIEVSEVGGLVEAKHPLGRDVESLPIRAFPFLVTSMAEGH